MTKDELNRQFGDPERQKPITRWICWQLHTLSETIAIIFSYV